MAYSVIEQRYVDMLLMSAFPNASNEPELNEEPSLDGVQLAAGPSATRTDAPAGNWLGGGPEKPIGKGQMTPEQAMEMVRRMPLETQTQMVLNRIAEDQKRGLTGLTGQMISQDPTLRQKLTDGFRELLKSQLGMDNYRAHQLSETLFGGDSSKLPLGIGLIDMTPFVLPLAAQESGMSAGRAFDAAGEGNYGKAALEYGMGSLQALETLPGVKVATTVAKAAAKNAKKLAPVAGQMAEDYLRKTGGLMQAAPDIKVFQEPIKVQPTINTLSGGFDNAIAQFTALDLQTRVSRVQQANQSLAKFLGTDNKTGKTKPLLTTNGKLLKTEKGVEGGEPIMLPDGRNVESAGLALSPAFKQGKFTTCPNSASCAGDCLGKTSGGYFYMGGGADLNALKGPRMRSFELTQAFMRDPENFAIKLNDEITALKIKAAKNGNHLAIRLNVLSDINPRVYEKVIKSHPDVTFYDYTKNNTNPIAPNHHYTYSSTGVSQPAGYNGLKEAINNTNQNWKQMRRRLDSGSNVAMAFSHKSILPERVIDEETGKIYKVIDGDTYDFRPLDIQPPGVDGVIVGLRNKAMTRRQETAAKDSSGFFVHFDPQIQKVKGKQVRDEAGRPVYGNKDVTIAKQGSGQVTLTNDYQPLKESK